MIIPVLWIVLLCSLLLAAGIVLGIMELAETLYVGYIMRRDGYTLMKNERNEEFWVK